MVHESKRLTLALKADGDEGAFSATFATLNVVDHQGDVTRPGAFEKGAEVLVGAYGHDTYQLPVGKGVIHADDERAWIDGQFILDSGSGRDTYETLKAAGDLIEWSYIFAVTKSSEGEFDHGDGAKQPVRFLEGIDVWSVDPVLKGAGIDTRTDYVKSRDPVNFAEQAGAVTRAVAEFTERAAARTALRAKDGRRISADGREQIGELVTRLNDLKTRLEDVLREPAAESTPDVEQTYLEFLATSAELQRVA